MLIFAVAVFLSAFLLFSVQPMVAKFILPAFGGTAAVWATCMVAFQTLLLAGYAYAHLLRTKLTPTQQRWAHVGMLAAGLLFLPPIPSVNAAAALAHPVRELLRSVLVSVGVPFFVLAATAPLLMEWFRQNFPNRTPDRLYAFSNAGSLLALVSYPALIEPSLGGKAQAIYWTGGIGVFFAICALAAWRSNSGGLPANRRLAESPAARAGNSQTKSPSSWLWISLSACGSALLLALTNQITQDVAPTPLLWVAPFAIYLITFILCFESTRFYRRWLFMPACFLVLLLLSWLLQEGYRQGFWVQICGYLGVLFCGCMVCHGELYRLRPPAELLTRFYLSLSLGGALGGMFVALVAPAIFPMILETPIIATGLAGLMTYILKSQRVKWSYRLSPIRLAVMSTLAVMVSLGYALLDQYKDSIYLARNFYGVYRVKESRTLLLDGVEYPLAYGPARVFLSGQIYHGLQFTTPEFQTLATSYYSEEGAMATALRELPVATNRNIGVIGLGAGAFAVHGQPGDHITFYELNPEVLRVAQTYFTFLTNSAARVDVILGDARLAMKSERPQAFDLLVVDAFTGDSIPTHLLTEEAIGVYLHHLKRGGVMVFNISNMHLDLRPVLRADAEKFGLTAVVAPAKFVKPTEGKLASVGMILTDNQDFLRQPAIVEMMKSEFNTVAPKPLLWSDDQSSILPLLR